MAGKEADGVDSEAMFQSQMVRLGKIGGGHKNACISKPLV